MLESLPWYSTSSSLFLATAALVIIGLITTILTVFILRLSSSKRRIMCSVISRSRLLSAASPRRNGLEVSFEHRNLAEPYLTTLEISNVARVPVLNSDFTQSRPLRFSCQSPIVTILDVEHKPDSAPSPNVRSEENEFILDPELLVRDEVVRASLITEGSPGKIRVSLNPFGAIEVQIRDRQIWLRQRAQRRIIAIFIGCVSVFALAFAASVVTSARIDKNYREASTALTGAWCVTIIGDSAQTQIDINNASLAANSLMAHQSSAAAATLQSNYESWIRTVRREAKQLTRDQVAASQSGIELGETARIPGVVGHAIKELEQLSSSDLGRSARKIIELRLRKDNNVVGSEETIPSVCRHL